MEIILLDIIKKLEDTKFPNVCHSGIIESYHQTKDAVIDSISKFESFLDEITTIVDGMPADQVRMNVSSLKRMCEDTKKNLPSGQMELNEANRNFSLLKYYLKNALLREFVDQ